MRREEQEPRCVTCDALKLQARRHPGVPCHWSDAIAIYGDVNDQSPSARRFTVARRKLHLSSSFISIYGSQVVSVSRVYAYMQLAC